MSANDVSVQLHDLLQSGGEWIVGEGMHVEGTWKSQYIQLSFLVNLKLLYKIKSFLKRADVLEIRENHNYDFLLVLTDIYQLIMYFVYRNKPWETY